MKHSISLQPEGVFFKFDMDQIVWLSTGLFSAIDSPIWTGLVFHEEINHLLFYLFFNISFSLTPLRNLILSRKVSCMFSVCPSLTVQSSHKKLHFPASFLSLAVTLVKRKETLLFYIRLLIITLTAPLLTCLTL